MFLKPKRATEGEDKIEGNVSERAVANNRQTLGKSGKRQSLEKTNRSLKTSRQNTPPSTNHSWDGAGGSRSKKKTVSTGGWKRRGIDICHGKAGFEVLSNLILFF